MVYDPQDTIAAIASATGAAARGVIRVAGPQALPLVATLWKSADGAAIDSLIRATMLRGEIDVGPPIGMAPCRLYIWPTERSYARQPTVEIHTIGSPPVLQAMLRATYRAGARPAGPGEFTLRAFLAGRLDLTQAEAVLGVIDATDRRDLDVALGQLAGGLAVPLTALRNQLLDLLAHLEAGLDFVEEDIEFISPGQLQSQLAAAAAAIAEIQRQTGARSVTQDTIRTALVGSPNVGKSSLFNALLDRSASIVSPTPGATRDYVAGALTLGDVKMELIDTADATVSSARWSTVSAPALAGSIVENAAQLATATQRQTAQIELLCLDSTRPLNEWENAALATESSAAQPPGTAFSASRRLIVLTKTDGPRRLEPIPGAIETSSAASTGLAELRARLQEMAIADRIADADHRLVAATSARCQESLRCAGAALERASKLAIHRQGEELIAAEVRLALDEIGQVTGAVYTEDVLDRVFSRFCIGK